MVTQEVEPPGGFMGDALAQPVYRPPGRKRRRGATPGRPRRSAPEH